MLPEKKYQNYTEFNNNNKNKLTIGFKHSESNKVATVCYVGSRKWSNINDCRLNQTSGTNNQTEHQENRMERPPGKRKNRKNTNNCTCRRKSVFPYLI